MLETIEDLYNKHAVFASNFNYFSGTYLHSYGGKTEKQLWKKKSIAKFIELKEKFDLYNICRTRNTKTKRFTFLQKSFSILIERRLHF